jgi:hypothetical protein
MMLDSLTAAAGRSEKGEPVATPRRQEFALGEKECNPNIRRILGVRSAGLDDREHAELRGSEV